MNIVDHTLRPERTPRRWWILWAALGLAALTCLLHGRAVTYGLFMDDHAHFRQLRDCGWSLGELARAGHLELIGGVIELWWMPECTLRFFRPVAFGLMKLVYVSTGWSPVAMHIASLAWHLAACILSLLLLRRLGTSRPLAWAVAALFAIHPGHIATVQWIASQTELIVTTLLLAALLCYAEFRRWPHDSVVTAPALSPQVRWRWGVACAALFAFALGCRENAIVFPLVALVTEPLVRRQRSRAALALFAVFGITIGAYLALRSHYLGGTALPPRPYVVPPNDPDFFRYVLDKACYYLLGEFLLVPCVPIGGLAYFRARPLVFYGLALVVTAILAAVVIRNRRRVSGVLGPACLVGFMAPVLPAFESPHHLYLPGIGWAILATLLFQTIGDIGGRAKNRIRRWRRRSMWLGIIITGLLFGVATHFFGLAFETAQAVEDQVVEEIATAPRPVNDGDTLYVANLPAIAHYVKLAVEERTGKRDLRVVALTWSPRLLGMATPSELRRVDARTIEVRVLQDRYFSGPLQLLTQQVSGGRIAAAARQPVRYKNFTAELLNGDDDGVPALRFTFDHDFAQTGVHLFWGSQTRWAYQVLPKRAPMELSQKLPAVRPLDVATFRNDRNELYFALHDLTQVAPQPIAVSLPGYFLLTQLDGEHTCRDVQTAFLKQFGQIISTDQIERMVTALDQALMLDNAGFQQAYIKQRNQYLAAKTRDNRHRYPPVVKLRSRIEQMLKSGSATAVTDLRGLIVPHLDYRRGGGCYADAYATLAQRPPAERYVILGTNHFGRSSSVVVTAKDFETPLGRVSADRDFIKQLELMLAQSLREHQFDHNTEHSVELQLHVLQVCYPEHPFRIVPVLCPDPSGPTGTVPHDGRGPDLADFGDALAALLMRDPRSTVLIAGADLSHVGQRFGDEQPTTPALLERVQHHDRHLLELLERRQEERFLETLRAAENPTRICSAGCIYALLRALPEQPCRVLRYHQAVDRATETYVTCAAAVVGS